MSLLPFSSTLEEDEKVFAKMSLGFNPCVFWKYHTKDLSNCGPPQAPFDPCLFIGEKVIAICYVHDLIFLTRNEKDIDDLSVVC
ncbi:hypothetical protein ACHAXS_002120 [Conticribra weissflogii]